MWSPKYGHDEIEKTLQILYPREVQHFSFNDQISEMKQNYPGERHTVFRENDQRRYSMFYHRCMAYKMATKYEQEHNIVFDWVVLVRLDATWLEPVLPIASYARDRVWLTETGYDLFNDQFMLIPRRFSDYLYDLNSKVQKGVYCLGGPDVEKFKCRDEKFRHLFAHCCADVDRENWEGGSECVHKRHLDVGEIPVSLGRFPVFLTRIQRDRSCHSECDRLQMNSVGLHANRVKESYEHFAPYVWPDTRGKAINYNDNSKCLLLKNREFDWDPLPAAELHSSRNLSAQFRVDYSRSLYAQQEHLHPSILMNQRNLDAWRVHPTWNVEGCLTYSFQHKTLAWTACGDHVRLKGGFSFQTEQSFFLHVVPHPEVVQSGLFGERFGSLRHEGSAYHNEVLAQTNLTRVMIPNRDHVYQDDLPGVACLSVVGPVRRGSGVEMQLCRRNKMHPNQLFRAVRGMTRGTHPESTVGRLHCATAPRLCVGRSPNREQGLSNVPLTNNLMLRDCHEEAVQQQVLFEFEQVA